MDQYPTSQRDTTEPTEPTDMVRDALERVKAATTEFVTAYAKQPEAGDFENSDIYQKRVERDAMYERFGLETSGFPNENGQEGAVCESTLAYVLDPTTKRFDRPNDGEGSVVVTITPLSGSDIEKRVAEVFRLHTESEKPMTLVKFIPNEERVEINGVSADNAERVFVDVEADDPAVPQEIAQLMKELADGCIEQFKVPTAVRETKRFMH